MREWLYKRIYADTVDDLRVLVREVVAPVVNLAKERSDGRWHFLQYVDAIGPHLRLRLRDDFDVDQVEADVREHVDRVIDQRALAGQPPRLVTRIYEPEYEKYGGPQGVEYAERIFQSSSELALSLSSPEHFRSRLTITAAHIESLLAIEPSIPRTSYLHQYHWYWSGRGRHAAYWDEQRHRLSRRDRVAGKLAHQLRAKVATLPTDDPAAAEAISLYAREFWQLQKECTGRPKTLGLGQHMHLTHNRLGVIPVEESLVSRLLWLEAS